MVGRELCHPGLSLLPANLHDISTGKHVLILIIDHKLLSYFQAETWCEGKEAYPIEINTQVDILIHLPYPTKQLCPQVQLDYLRNQLQLQERTVGGHDWWSGAADVWREGDWQWQHSLGAVQVKTTSLRNIITH